MLEDKSEKNTKNIKERVISNPYRIANTIPYDH